MSEKNKSKFQARVCKIEPGEWSIGFALSHATYGDCSETYLFFNLIKWNLAIGFMGD